MKTRDFETHEGIAEFFENNPKDTNWIILDCYKHVLKDENGSEVHPFSFKEDNEKFFIEVSEGDSSVGLARLMDKAVKEEHYEVAQEVKELVDEHGVELREGAMNMEVVEDK